VSQVRVLVLGDGRHELGADLGQSLNLDNLPALPSLIHRLMDCPAHVSYTCEPFRRVKPVHTRGHKYAKKVRRAIQLARQNGYQALAVVIDRDRQKDADRIVPLQDGRDAMASGSLPACAVGMAVEAFDSWMIADSKAVTAAAGDPGKTHPKPESLAGKEGTGDHPKDVAGVIFGAKAGLGDKYAVVAENVDLDLLAKACPKGFAPFAEDVRRHILPAVTNT